MIKIFHLEINLGPTFNFWDHVLHGFLLIDTCQDLPLYGQSDFNYFSQHEFIGTLDGDEFTLNDLKPLLPFQNLTAEKKELMLDLLIFGGSVFVIGLGLFIGPAKCWAIDQYDNEGKENRSWDQYRKLLYTRLANRSEAMYNYIKQNKVVVALGTGVVITGLSVYWYYTSGGTGGRSSFFTSTPDPGATKFFFEKKILEDKMKQESDRRLRELIYKYPGLPKLPAVEIDLTGYEPLFYPSMLKLVSDRLNVQSEVSNFINSELLKSMFNDFDSQKKP